MKKSIIVDEEHRVSSKPKKFSLSSEVLFKLVGVSILVLFLLGLSFLAGMHYQKSHQGALTSSMSNQNLGPSGPLGRGGFGRRRGLSLVGQVTAISPTSITLTNQNGVSTTLTITASTVITNNGQPATISDIQVGNTVAIVKDTTVATQAARILLNPGFGTNTSPSATPPPSNTQLN